MAGDWEQEVQMGLIKETEKKQGLQPCSHSGNLGLEVLEAFLVRCCSHCSVCGREPKAPCPRCGAEVCPSSS